MFSFVQHLAGGWWEFALFLVTVSVSLSLLESQMAVLAMVVSRILLGYWGDALASWKQYWKLRRKSIQQKLGKMGLLAGFTVEERENSCPVS